MDLKEYDEEFESSYRDSECRFGILANLSTVWDIIEMLGISSVFSEKEKKSLLVLTFNSVFSNLSESFSQTVSKCSRAQAA